MLKLRDEGVAFKEMENFFEGRTWQALVSRHGTINRDPSAPKRKRGKAWTKEEDKKLLELAAEDKAWEEMMTDLPGRSANSIQGRFNLLMEGGVSAPETVKVRYTPEEDNLLLALRREGKTFKEIADYFPKRSQGSLTNRHLALARPTEKGDIRRKWTSDDIADLKQALDRKLTWAEISKLLNRSEIAVKRQAYLMRKAGQLDQGARATHANSLTPAELELIRTKRGEGVVWKEIVRQFFPGKSVEALISQYYRYLKRQQKEDGE